MSDDPFHETVKAIRARGYKVEPAGDDLGLWLVDDEVMTDSDLMVLALRLGLTVGPEAMQ